MLVKIYAISGGRITNTGNFEFPSDPTNFFIPNDNTISANGNVVVGQEQIYNAGLPIPEDYTYNAHKGFIAFDTRPLKGFINSGYRIYSSSVYYKPQTIYQNISWNIKVRMYKHRDPYIVNVNHGWYPLNIDNTDQNWVSDVPDDWFSCQQIINEFAVSGLTEGAYNNFSVNPYLLHISGFTEFKLTSNRFDDPIDSLNNEGWLPSGTYRESMYIYGFNTATPPFLVVGLAGMRYLRLEDLSLNYHLKKNLSLDPTISGVVEIKDGFPDDLEKLTPPVISIEHLISDLTPVEISENENIGYDRSFAIDIFARSRGELDDLTVKVENFLKGSYPIYDYNSGFPENGYNPTRIGTAFLSNLEIDQVEPIPDIPASKFHSIITVSSRSTLLNHSAERNEIK